MQRLGFLAAGLLACTSSPPLREIAVSGSDYAFEGPDSLASGVVAFSFENRGQVPHEVKVIALKPGKTLADVFKLDDEGKDLSEALEPTSGILTAGPGQTTPGRLLVDLQPGRTYVLVCGFQDTDTSDPHFALGMVREIKVY